jgi:DNA repair exonuclease SbcCD ATPase subunit
MDIKNFQDRRNQKLFDFEKRFDFLKQEYTQTLNMSLLEEDSTKQPILVSRIQQLNTQMTDELREIITELTKQQEQEGSIDNLTQQLIQYQKDYAEIQQSQDKLTTLKLIKNSNSQSLNEAETMYWLYLGGLILLTFLIIFNVFKVSFSSSIDTIKQTLIPQR